MIAAINNEKMQATSHNFAVIRSTKEQSQKTTESRNVKASTLGLSAFSWVQPVAEIDASVYCFFPSIVITDRDYNKTNEEKILITPHAIRLNCYHY